MPVPLLKIEGSGEVRGLISCPLPMLFCASEDWCRFLLFPLLFWQKTYDRSREVSALCPGKEKEGGEGEREGREGGGAFT